jgi:serine/threonine protein kinase
MHIDQFEPQTIIGKGAFGEVRKAIHKQSGKEVAIKIIDN